MPQPRIETAESLHQARAPQVPLNIPILPEETAQVRHQVVQEPLPQPEAKKE